MRAVCLEAVGRLVVIEAEKPAITGSEDVLIQVRKVGVCGSELHAFDGTHPYRKPPSVLGHEMMGTVIEVGTGVTRVAVGDRVTVDPQWPCGECEWCQRGEHNLCPSKRVLGTNEWPGALGEFIVVPQRSVFAVPAGFSDVQAATVEPLGVGVRAVRRAAVQPGESVLIFGSGPIGLLTGAVAKAHGAETLIFADIKPHCLETARQMGATHTVLVGQEDVAEAVMTATDGQGVDVVFLTVGVEDAFDVAFDAVRKHGRIMVVALFDGPVTLNPYRIISKEVTILGMIMSDDDDVHEAFRLIEAGEVDTSPIVTHQMSWSEAQRGFELATSKDDGAIKVVLNFD